MLTTRTDQLPSSETYGWSALTQLAPNGDGGLIAKTAAGVAKLTLDASGNLSLVGNVTSAGNVLAGAAGKFQFSGLTQLVANGDGGLLVKTAGGTTTLTVTSSGTLSTSGAVLVGGNTTVLSEAANTLALRNGTNAQAIRLYNTYTDASNYERTELNWSGNTAFLTTGSAGTGIGRSLVVGTSGNTGVFLFTNGNSRWQVNGAGHLLAVADSTYDIGTAGTSRPRDVNAGRNVLAGATGEFQFTGSSRLTANGDGGLIVKTSADVAKLTLDSSAGLTLNYGSNSVTLSNSGWPRLTAAQGSMYFQGSAFSIHSSGAFTVVSSGQLGFASGGANLANDTYLTRDAAGTMALKNGTNNQTLNIYSTYTNSSNYERGTLQVTSTYFYILTQAAGSGVARAIRIGPNNTPRWEFSNTGALFPISPGNYDIGGAANPLRDLYVDRNVLLGVTAGITASTTQTQGQGALTKDVNEVTTVANSNDVVTLPTATVGMAITVINAGANTLQIFPATGASIGSGATNASTTLAAGATATFFATTTTKWRVK